MPEYLIKTLLNELYLHSTGCGPDHLDISYHPWIDYKYSNNLGVVPPHIIPDCVCHPEVKACIDFNHQFVLNADNTEISGQRPVSKEILKNTAIQLLRFFSYYFDYVLSYGKGPRGPEIKFLIEKFNSGFENEVLYFINSIFNYFITNIAIDRSRNGIGTCTITLKDNPNYRKNKRMSIFIDKSVDILNQIFAPMLPITVWAKGRLYKNYYFPIFDGYLMATSIGNAEGFTTLTLTCKDSLELARVSQEMINPAIIQIKEFSKQNAINIWAKPFFGLDHMKIFDLMFNGGALVYNPDKRGGELMSYDDRRLKNLWKSAQEGEFINFTSLGRFKKINENSQVSLKDLSNEKAIHKDNFNLNTLIEKTSHVTRPRCTASWGYSMTPYRIFQFQTPDMFTSTFESRLSVIRSVASMVYYELYVDGYGTIHYHPMRLINDYLYYDRVMILQNEIKHQWNFPGAQIIGPEETINMNTMFNIEELTTFLRLSGVHSTIGSATRAELLNLVGEGRADHYMARYGYRRQTVSNPLFNFPTTYSASDGSTKEFFDLAAKELLNYMNAELYTRTATIVFRPEIELAAPVFFTDDNNVFYVQSISHSITVGGEATTTINANFGRKDMQPATDLMSLLLKSEKLFKSEGKVLEETVEEGVILPAIDTEEYEGAVQRELDKFFEIKESPAGSESYSEKEESEKSTEEIDAENQIKNSSQRKKQT